MIATDQIALVVLAAGKGTRMRSDLPKVLHKVAGRSLLGHVLSNAAALQPSRTVVVTGHQADLVADEVKIYDPVAVAVHQAEQKGTAHAVLQAERALEGFEGVVLVLYGDHPFISAQTLRELARKIENDVAVSVLGFEPEEPGGYGRLIVGQKDRLERIVEIKDALPEEAAIGLCNSGVMALRADVAFKILHAISSQNAQQEFYLTDAVAIAREQGYDCGYALGAADELMGINSQKERAVAEAWMQDKLRMAALEQGAILHAPHTVHMEMDTLLEPGAVIEPYVVFGANVQVKAGAQVKAFSHLEGVVLESKAVAGPFARLRPGTYLHEGAKIGSFVETKKVIFEAGAKASHLSYIGDASVGAGANIGGGTITCNYDGFDKFETWIGAGAFVGSNSALVAPVSVGKGAIIGAGSTVLSDVPADATRTNITPERTVENGAETFRRKKS